MSGYLLIFIVLIPVASALLLGSMYLYSIYRLEKLSLIYFFTNTCALIGHPALKPLYRF